MTPPAPIQLVVPYVQGGGSDQRARLVARYLAQVLDEPVEVVNRTGAVVGHTLIARAAPDGRTLGQVSGEVGMMHWTAGLTDLGPADYTAGRALRRGGQHRGASGCTMAHAGRPAGRSPAAPVARLLPAVVEPVQGRVPVFVDGGFRRGGDVAKALALGASAVFAGRPVLRGLAARGAAGAAAVLAGFIDELLRAMVLLGCVTPDDLRRLAVRSSEPLVSGRSSP